MKFYYLLHPRPIVIIGSGSIKNNEVNFMACSAQFQKNVKL